METTSRRPWSELTLLLVVGTAVLIAAAVTDAFDSPGAWTLVAVLAGAYALSRGTARNELHLPERPVRIRATVPAEGAQTHATASETAAEFVVSEEQLEVDKRRRPTERVRLRKDVVTEEVTITVPVRREVVRLERVPIEPGESLEGDAVPFELAEGRTQELVLMEERAVVDTRVVPRERVWLEKSVETTEEHFTQTVRREEVELDREPAPGGESEQEHRP
jgi:uncharacterized protein (TIGR02271 family)